MKTTLGIIIGVMALAAACGPTTITYERNAMVDAPSLPSRTGRPLKWGEFRAAFEVNPVLVAPQTRHAGNVELIDSYQQEFTDDAGNIYHAWKDTYSDRSSSLITPVAQFGGHIYYALCDYVELGIQGMYGSHKLAYKSLYETRAFPPGEERDTWKFGIGARFNIPFNDTGFTLSFLNEWNVTKLSEYTVMTVQSGTGSYNWASIDAWVDDKYVLRPVLGFQGTYEILDWLHGYFFGVFQLGTKNSHVTVEKKSDAFSLGLFDTDSLESYAMFDVGLGIEVQYKYGFLNVAGFYPLHGEMDDIQQGPGLMMQLGVNLPFLGDNAITGRKKK